MEVRPGSRLRSSVCQTEVIAVKADGDMDITCGGVPMVDAGTEVPDSGLPTEGADGGTLMGKRYVSADETLELLCTKPGAGSLGIGATLMEPKATAPLPASD